ncbi:4-(cytidine 5'-diphospho)-2-C-methyl-D-erythritol kinase [Roseomonas terrae]|uniref:4-diphosphocytidyl-2-C-methyl-D-erythritol kinase n=1 Tax=Neoroseomonas terrae TaxID=424799 RepID=A0ABS5EAG9_9PROT|nr:4-(cytidine 5'-diphospho)-2-C-methyl-D-erythritol kinase [Neoroseomonas terrae]MBR0648032.1 4-(cytidine 5'-diphospho)-2-C-methyl-D-erythritol kinase [Neoroseomonas terrae]
MIEAAPAKVNLYLHCTGRRGDGYHLLDSLVVFAGVGDVLRAAPSKELTLALDGPAAGPLTAEADNLVLRAARLLAQAAGMPAAAALALTKQLPVASGIGGGSADAAAALRALNGLWGLGWAEARLAVLAAQIGADVPVCLMSRPCRMEGIGEILSPAPQIPDCGLVLANPQVALSTPSVFRARNGAFSARAALPGGWPSATAMARDLALLRNDLEAPAMELCPPVAEVLAALRGLPGCLLARMSGSGATCFALLAEPAAATNAARSLPESWWRWGGGFHAVAPGARLTKADRDCVP